MLVFLYCFIGRFLVCSISWEKLIIVLRGECSLWFILVINVFLVLVLFLVIFFVFIRLICFCKDLLYFMRIFFF